MSTDLAKEKSWQQHKKQSREQCNMREILEANADVWHQFICSVGPRGSTEKILLERLGISRQDGARVVFC